MRLEDKSCSIVIPIFNQEDIIEKVIRNTIDLSSKNVKRLILLIDGCTDSSKKIVLKEIKNNPNDIAIDVIETPNIFELRCCNRGFKLATDTHYIINLQSDDLVLEKNFDQKWIEPFAKIDNLLAVSARDAVDGFINQNGELDFCNIAGKDVGFKSPKMFSVRDIINRPIAFDNQKLKELNYFDENYFPGYHADTDISLRGWRDKKWVVGCYPVDYFSDLSWGASRKFPESGFIAEMARIRNAKIIVDKYKDQILSEKHSYDLEIV